MIIPIASIAGIIILLLAIFALAKFAESTLSTVISVAVILVAVFLIFGAPNVDSISGKMDEVSNILPTTSGAVMAGESLEVTGLENRGNVLVITVKNTGMKPLSSFEVLVGKKKASIAMETSVPPGARGVIAVNERAQAGDAVLVKSGTARDTKVFTEASKITSSTFLE